MRNQTHNPPPRSTTQRTPIFLDTTTILAYIPADTPSPLETKTAPGNLQVRRAVLISQSRQTPGTRLPGESSLAGGRTRAASDNSLRYKRFFADFMAVPIQDVWRDTSVSGFSEARSYVIQTNPEVICRCINMVTDPGDLVLDPTCGGGTTADVAAQWGRRWITIETSRLALALARARIMGARYPYYLLADSRDGQQKGS